MMEEFYCDLLTLYTPHLNLRIVYFLNHINSVKITNRNFWWHIFLHLVFMVFIRCPFVGSLFSFKMYFLLFACQFMQWNEIHTHIQTHTNTPKYTHAPKHTHTHTNTHTNRHTHTLGLLFTIDSSDAQVTSSKDAVLKGVILPCQTAGFEILNLIFGVNYFCT